ncbi:Glycoside hydrolase, 38 vacuolar alpha mannosidase [Coemansia asiatica]|uniref:Alpha-mannosidase n=1 Tax=Coemansia asiatica TaxID=1052880 RepID=A0A9W7XJP9_9FUNG|nr:Glycoside hydrolase, 38 vacuolar alpha mannosidase [Coemansia asiatica]
MQRHMSYLQKHPSITRSRVNNFINDNQWKDVNIKATLYDMRISGEPHVQLEAWSAPGQDRPTFEHAVKQNFKPAKVGQLFGPSWTTHWFRVTATIPESFAGKKVLFMFDTNSEAMVWSDNGEPILGLTGGNGGERHVDYLLTKCASSTESPRTFYVEMACNGLFGNGDYHVHPQDREIYYQLSSAEIVAPNESAWQLFHDLEVIVEMANRLPQESPRSWQALTAANDIVNVFEHSDLSTIEPALEIARKFLSFKTSEASHSVFAIGNCHIDTAWLWPFAETKRKAARSWATQLYLMEDYPEYRFAASQAQQFQWLLENYPSLFKRIQKKAKDGQFIPIGGTWVEMDCNLPSGESLVRQFLLGQRFFKQHFGEYCDVFWLPDTFGYSSQLPQIVRLSGAKYFFTQKLSWNNINKFPHTTFRWIGLDGSHVLCHMSPAETYGAQCRPGELIDSVKRHKDIAYTNESLYLYGNGDGGGGPLRSMLERLRRMQDVDGLPRVKQAHPREFYKHVEDTARELVSWKGELYFELHRGTYTSQSNNKRWNRQSEFLLRDAEMLCTVAHIRSLANNNSEFEYPSDEFTRLWRMVCLNQFHDVLPGSAINMVYRDSDSIYKDIFESVAKIRQNALYSIYGHHNIVEQQDMTKDIAFLNTTVWMRSDMVKVPESLVSRLLSGFGSDSHSVQRSAVDKDNVFALVNNVPGFGTSHLSNQIYRANTATTIMTEPVVRSVHVYQNASKDSFVMENTFVRIVIDSNGHITSFYDLNEQRELVPKGEMGNVFELYDDVPLYWDAWDEEVYLREKFKPLDGVDLAIIESGPLVASISARVPISDQSVLTQIISLSAISPRLDFDCEIDWHENRKSLKTSFTWDINSDFATYETQYGVVQRPTHRNTSWDLAKFEVCAHKFSDLSEYGYGVALLNDCKYGHSTLGNTTSLSLIRAPKAPDEHCDMGSHKFRYAIYPHKGTFSESNVVQEAYQFNVPLLQIPLGTSSGSQMVTTTAAEASPFFSLTGAPNVVLDTVKVAEDDKSSYIVRLYEAYGGHGRALLTSRLKARHVQKVNILEEPIANDLDYKDDDSTVKWLQHSRTVEVNVKPFEVVTLKFSQ